MRSYQDLQMESTEDLPSWYDKKVHAKICKILNDPSKEKLHAVKYLYDLSKKNKTHQFFELSNAWSLIKFIQNENINLF